MAKLLLALEELDPTHQARLEPLGLVGRTYYAKLVEQMNARLAPYLLKHGGSAKQALIAPRLKDDDRRKRLPRGRQQRPLFG
ncbi:hypothetical protein [Mesorhizobium sp. WSM4962]|uniref:hypothetical protein n=1 Tax=Mesorhizobium sp. WSM4962 TaxID=3038548 RepID=UPI003FA5A8BF